MTAKTKNEYAEKFAFDGKDNILEEKDFGIVNDRITAGINYSRVTCVDGIWAPPYVSSDFFLELRLYGKKVHTNEYKWHPFEFTAKGGLNVAEVSCCVTLIPGKRAFVIEIKILNPIKKALTVPVEIAVQGCIGYIAQWDFQRPASKTGMDAESEKNRIIKTNHENALIVGTDLRRAQWVDTGECFCSQINLSSEGLETFYIIAAFGQKEETLKDYETLARNPQKAIDEAHKDYNSRAAELFRKLPLFESSDKNLQAFYYRSLTHYLTNHWQVPEFALNPFYSTGSIKGGCLLSYLWDFSEGWELHPLFDPQALKKHIKQYLKIDITSCFSFNPITGGAVGPWYPVNQEKIIGLVYYYVLHTGDTAFLTENVNGKTVLDWVIYHAAFGDVESGEAALYDYGFEGEHHLELRRGYPYNGVMPDLNARRYQSYMWAFELAAATGRDAAYLRSRAEQLKGLVKKELWNKQENWFDFISADRRDTRYTVQMFKLISSGVLDVEEQNGLLSHLNEDEFLSLYGLHSLSKKDPAYDPADIDNGGPGSCSVFPPQIIERLYKAGLPDYAEDILKRILWWGIKVPYWGDSFTADHIGYREDTPLQCTIGGVAGAQMIIFGMFGVSVLADGNISFKPNPPSFSPEISLKGLKLRNSSFDIAVKGGKVTVKTGSISISFGTGKECIYVFEGGNFVCQ